jgi:hypothetical protein
MGPCVNKGPCKTDDFISLVYFPDCCLASASHYQIRLEFQIKNLFGFESAIFTISGRQPEAGRQGYLRHVFAMTGKNPFLLFEIWELFLFR